MERPPTIRDIATACNVHFTTVSRALRNDPRIPESTRKRIMQIAERMGYRINPLYAALMSRVRSGQKNWHSETIAFITSSEESCNWRHKHGRSLIYKGMYDQLKSFGWSVDIFDNTAVLESRLSNILKARGIRGVILACLPHQEPLNISLSWSDFTAVQIEMHSYLPMLPCICNDRGHAIKECYKRVQALGYKRIGLAVPTYWDRYLEWISGYLGAAHGLPGSNPVEPYYSQDWSQAAFARWLKKERPDVILTVDRSYIWQWLKALKIRVPDDVAYVEMDLTDHSNEFAGIQQSHEIVGAEAVRTLAGRLYQNETGPLTRPMVLHIGGEWQDGASAPAVKASRVSAGTD